jgi:hypothetical protein
MRMTRWILAPTLSCAISLNLVHALPRFAASTGYKCQSCHVNPSGGSMRQVFGVQYGREQLPVPTWSQEFELEDFTTLLTNVLGVGADFRTLFFARQIPDTGTSGGSKTENAFWQMQGDLYLNFRIAKHVNLFLKKGLYSGFEAYGLFTLLPARGHIKVGKFVPNFGTKLDDHTAFIRTYTGFSAAIGRPELTGLEAGVSPGPLSITAGLFNATDGFAGTGGSSKAVLGRVEGIFPLQQTVFLGIGADIFRRESNVGPTETLYGGFGSFALHEFSVFGEVDLVESKTSSRKVTGIVAYAEANYILTPGVDLKLAYDFYDPDKDVKSGSISRYSFGMEFFPIAGVEVRPMYRIVREDPVDVKDNEFHLLFHIYL